MGFFSALFRNFPDGCRDAMRSSYRKHYDLALSGASPSRMDPHQAGLLGALGTRYKRRGIILQFSEIVLWSELAPFLLMSKEESFEALTEYVLWQDAPSAAKTAWLRTKINEALSHNTIANEERNSVHSLAPVAFFNNVKWCELLDPSIKTTLSREAAKL